MSSSSLMRLGGLATMLAGALLIISTIPILMGVIGLDLTKFAEEATTGTHALLTRLGVLATILLQGGLAALYAYRSEARPKHADKRRQAEAQGRSVLTGLERPLPDKPVLEYLVVRGLACAGAFELTDDIGYGFVGPGHAVG